MIKWYLLFQTYNMDTSLSDGERSSELDQSSDQQEAEEGPDRKRLKTDPDVSTNSETDDPLAKLLESPTSDQSRLVVSIISQIKIF